MSSFAPTPAAESSASTPASARGLSLSASIIRGAWAFCLVSIAGFVPWALFGRPLARALGEAGLYAVCAVVFVTLSGLLLHPLIPGRRSLRRFYVVFTPAFTGYSAAWIVGWMALRGHVGSVVGLLAGTSVMAWLLTRALRVPSATLTVAAVLFLGNAAGYFLGGIVESRLRSMPNLSIGGTPLARGTQARVAMLAWGVFYGLGLGAGLGFAFHRCRPSATPIVAEVVDVAA